MPAALPEFPFALLSRLSFPSLPHPAQAGVAALNLLFKREAWARTQLLRHAGKTIRIEIGHVAFSATITSEGLLTAADDVVRADVTLTIPIDKLSLDTLLSLRNSPDGTAVVDITRISGDAALAQVVGELARHLRWDVEDDLARLVGDIPASQFLRFARKLRDDMRQAGLRLTENTAEYLTQEQQVLVARAPFEMYGQDVAQTAADVDVLAAKIARLHTTVGAAHALPNVVAQRSTKGSH